METRQTEPNDPEEAVSPGRSLINEDWLATIVGLVLLALVLAGVIRTGMVP